MPITARTLALPAAVAAALALAACGGSDSTAGYADRLAPLDERIQVVGTDVAGTLEQAPGMTEPELQEAFAAHADALGAVVAEVRELDAPDTLDGQADRLTAALDDTTASLDALAEAAGGGDGMEAAQAAGRLTQDAAELRAAREALAAEAADAGAEG